MSQPGYLAFYCASSALLTGLVAFMFNWQVVGGGWSWFPVLLFPGNLVLALFSEEINFWPKLALQMAGQFMVTFMLVYCLLYLIKTCLQKTTVSR